MNDILLFHQHALVKYNIDAPDLVLGPRPVPGECYMTRERSPRTNYLLGISDVYALALR